MSNIIGAKALVIFYNGQGLTERLRTAIANLLAKEFKAIGAASILEFDAEDIAKLLVKNSVNDECSKTQEQIKNPEEHAVVYVGEIMKDCLGSAYKPESFIEELTRIIAKARNSSAEEDIRLMTALSILSKENLQISQSLLRKYKLNERKIMIIKRVYNLISKL